MLSYLKQKKERIFELLICSVSGAGMSCSISSERYFWLAFVSLIPLIFLIIKSRNNEGTVLFRRIFTFYFVYFILSVRWISLINENMYNGKKTTYIIITSFMVLEGIIHAVVIAAFMCIFQRIRHNEIIDVFSFSFLFILGEWFHETMYPVTFPWLRVAAAVSPFTSFIQSSDLFGSLFISFLVISVNGLLTVMIYNIYLKRYRTSARGIFILALLFMSDILYGIYDIGKFQKYDNYFDVVLVQSGLGETRKHTLSDEDTLKYYRSILEDLSVKDGSLVILPESAFTFNISPENVESKMLCKCMSDKDCEVLSGFYLDKHNKKYNSMMIINSEKSETEVYSKKILVPFGEMLPFEKVIGKPLRSVFQDIGCFSQGDKSCTIETCCGTAGGIICYESLYPASSRNAVKEKADFLVVLSNDSWFDGSSETYQHHAHSVLRASENKRYVLRCSSTGITSIISPTGKVTACADGRGLQAVYGSAAPVSVRSLYSRIGDIIIIPGVFIFIKGILKKREQQSI